MALTMTDQPAAPRMSVLIADDKQDILIALKLLLKSHGLEVITATSPATVLTMARAEEPDAALIDLNYSRGTTCGAEGLDLLTELRALDPTLPVLVMTAWSNIELAVEAMRRGARDFVAKPWENERLVAQLKTQLEVSKALRRTRRLEHEARALRERSGPPLIASARSMQPALDVIQRVGPSTASVLITGEHGTGKEVIAHHLHAASPRCDGPFVTVNAGGLADGVFESELFGHVKGAFTDARTTRVGFFELADGGTLFLDEVANMPLRQQAKLLRVLQTGEFRPVGSSRTRRVDVRLLAATNADLDAAVSAGLFREDLLYRLNTVELRLPPLRERSGDIEPLAAHFLTKALARYGKHDTIRGLTPAAVNALRAHAWPGNVRELEHVIERGVLMAQDGLMDELALGLRPMQRDAASGLATLERMTLDEVERHVIRASLRRFDGNVSQAADALGLSRSALYRRLQRFGLTGAP